MTFRHFMALEVAALVASSSAPARPTVLGVVEEADRGHLNNGAVSPGATVYDGDRFSTERGGMLLLRADAAMLELGDEGEVVVRRSVNDGLGTAGAGQGDAGFQCGARYGRSGSGNYGDSL